LFSGGLPLNSQLQVEIPRASTVITAVPFPWKLETHPIRGSSRNNDRHNLASFVTAAAFTDDAGDLGDTAVAVAPGAGVSGGEDPKRAAECTAPPARGAQVPFGTGPDAGALAVPAAFHPGDLDRFLNPLCSLVGGKGQGEAKIGAGKRPPVRLLARDSQKGEQLATQGFEHLFAVPEALEPRFAEAPVASFIVETASMPIAQHVVGLGYQLEPLLGARIARVAVRVVVESQLTKSALDLIE